MKTIDYYGHWNAVRTANASLTDREEKIVDILRRYAKPGHRILDAGCGNGRFMEYVAGQLQGVDIEGVDFSAAEVNEAVAKGLKVTQGNFEEGIQFPDSQLDIVHASEVLEHLYNPDYFLQEAFRILRPDGLLVISTPNLCAWYNRILVAIGTQPLFLEASTQSTLVGAGFLRKLKRGSTPVGHVRIFTLQAVRDILELTGFSIKELQAACFDEGMPKAILWFDKILCRWPSLASDLIVVARKMNK